MIAGKRITLAELFAEKERQAQEQYRRDRAEEEDAGDARKAARAQERYELGLELGWWNKRGEDIEQVESESDDDEEEDGAEEDE